MHRRRSADLPNGDAYPDTAPGPVSRPQSWRSPQTTWIKAFCAILFGLFVGAVLGTLQIHVFAESSMPGASVTFANMSYINMSDANTPNVYSSADVLLGPFSMKRNKRAVERNHAPPNGNAGSNQGTTELRDAPSPTKPLFNWMHLSWSVLHKMNFKLWPCEDFYNYACEKLIKDTIIPDGKDTVNTFTVLDDLLRNQLLSLVSAEIDQKEATFYQLPKKLYQLCMNKTRIEDQGYQPLLDILDWMGGWPVLQGDDWDKNASWSWENSVKNLRKLGYSTSYFFDVFVRADLTNSSRRVIYINSPTLSLRHEYLVEGREEIDTYINYSVDMALLLGAKEARNTRELRDSVFFEAALSRNSQPDGVRQDAFLMSMKEFQSKYAYTNWIELFNEMFLDTNIVIDENETIIVLNPIFMEKFGELLKSTSKRVLANYVMRRVINFSSSFLPMKLQKLQMQYRAKLCDELKQEQRCLDMTIQSLPSLDEPLHIREYFDDAIGFLSSSTTKKHSVVQEKERRCLDIISERLPIPVGALYIRKYSNDSIRHAALGIVTEVKNAFVDLLKTVQWMDESTREIALEKMDSMVLHVGYPDELMDDNILNDYYKNLEFIPKNSYLNVVLYIDRFARTKKFKKLRQAVNKTDWTTWSNQAGVDAFYDPIDNSIQFPANYLQGQLFSYDLPNYINYGAIGVIIGREITRAIDDEGRQYDMNGNPRDWWQKSTADSFEKINECIQYQYGNYTEPTVNINLSGYNTLPENVADNGGIKAAYYAYKKWIEKKGPEPLPPHHSLTPEQMFWISAAQAWYSVYRPETIREIITNSFVSPGQFRVLGSMSNMIEFSNDFHCRSGTPMNPPKKCQVW